MCLEPAWQPLPEELALTPADVHVVQANLERSAVELAQLQSHLSADEQERADRFYFDRHRRRFIAGRGLLRRLIGGYLDLPPASLQFAYPAQGKPELAPALDQPGFRFNLAHSESLALFAFSWGRELGIDVEFRRELVDAEAIAARFFSARENALFAQLHEGQKQAAFFDCWTRKEAFIKAIGEGLSHPLDQFDVDFAPGQPARLLYVAGEEDTAAQWSMQALQPAADYSAALVVKGRGWRLSCWTWPD